MKKRTIVIMAFIAIIALVAFCNCPSERGVAKDSTEIVTVQSDTISDTISVAVDTVEMNGKYVSETWLRNRLKHHGVTNESHVDKFIYIAKRESRLDPSVVNRTLNRNKTIDSGLFQINSCHKGLYAKYDLLDPEQNLLAALELYNIAGFKPWRASIGSAAS